MYSLFCEAKFWTLKNDVQIKNTELGVLRYYDKKEVNDCPYFEGKKSYCSQRGTTLILKNKRPLKLKDRLKELEQQLNNYRVVFFEWKDDNVLFLILNNGLIIIIGVNAHSKDIYKIMFDRFLIGKLLSENICDVLLTKLHLVISYNENQLTLINFNKLLCKSHPPEKLVKLEPKVQHVDLHGPTGRRIDRKLSCNKTGDSVLTWWHSTRNEVYPWSPLVKDEDRANVHVYSLVGIKIELLCFYRTEFDLIDVWFSQIKPNVVWLIEQKVSKKGDVTVEYSLYEIVKKVFKKISVTSIPLQTQICCHSVSPDEEKLVLGCIDGSIVLFDESRGITRLVKSAFIPNLVSWHNDGALIAVANERNQFQFFDIALSCVRIQLLTDDVSPSNLLDLASFFKTQPILLGMKWNKKLNATFCIDKFIPSDHLLLLIFESGPLGVLNLIGGGGLSNDVQCTGLTPDTLIRQYLLWNQNDKALNILFSLNWNTNGSTCLAGLYHIANHVFRRPLSPEGEIQFESALGSFYAPIRPLTRFTENEFGNQIHDLTRRFFHLLLRHQLYEKAYCLAIDLCNVDLFVDLYHCAKLLKDEEMALACKAKIEELNCMSESSSHSSRSHSPCSCSESFTESEENGILPPLPQVSVKKSKASRVPPLPDLNRHNKIRGSAFFNCNPSYSLTDNETPNGFDSRRTSFTDYYSTFFSSASKTPELNYSTTQILTPEFPHTYEIRTSFTGRESSVSSFSSSDPNFGIHNNADLLSLRGNVIESLYDHPSNPSLLGSIEANTRNFQQTLLDSSVNSFGPLKLKSPELQFNQTSPKAGPLDYIFPSMPRCTYNGNRPSLLNSSNLTSQYPLTRNSVPRPPPYAPIPRHFNNLMLQRPLHFVPNPLPRHLLKPMNPSIAKQKVKFSDTVTHIVVPNLSKISIEDETLTSQPKGRSYKSPKSLNVSPDHGPSFTERTGNKTTCVEFAAQQEQQQQQEEEETNDFPAFQLKQLFTG